MQITSLLRCCWPSETIQSKVRKPEISLETTQRSSSQSPASLVPCCGFKGVKIQSWFTRILGAKLVSNRRGLAPECFPGYVRVLGYVCMGFTIPVRLLIKKQFIFPELWFYNIVFPLRISLAFLPPEFFPYMKISMSFPLVLVISVSSSVDFGRILLQLILSVLKFFSPSLRLSDYNVQVF